MPWRKVSALVIPRLSLYYRALCEVKEEKAISSEELAKLTHTNAAQVRKDLTYFGRFGAPGKGYTIERLKKRLLNILGTNKIWNVAIVGVGNLGSALLAYKGFSRQGFNIVAAFDHDLRKLGKIWDGIEIQDISEVKDTLKKRDIQMAIVAVSADNAQRVVDLLVKSGIRAILNFAPIRPKVPTNIELVNIDLSIELERLAHFLRRTR